MSVTHQFSALPKVRHSKKQPTTELGRQGEYLSSPLLSFGEFAALGRQEGSPLLQTDGQRDTRAKHRAQMAATGRANTEEMSLADLDFSLLQLGLSEPSQSRPETQRGRGRTGQLKTEPADAPDRLFNS